MGVTDWQRTLPPDPGALFAYGTLRFPEVLRELLGRVPELAEGTLADWRVAALTDRNAADDVTQDLETGSGPTCTKIQQPGTCGTPR